MNQSNIESAINNYLNTNSKGFGILLDGSWGTGKTWVVKEKVLKEKNHLYISLFGVSKIKEIEDKIISELLNVSELSDDNIKNSTNFLGKISELLDFGEKGEASAIAAIAASVSTSIKKNIVNNIDANTIIIFDDLERAKLTPTEILSYANFFIENGNKVIFIANESEISDDKYKATKEKVIGYTYKLVNSLIDIYHISISYFKDEGELYKKLQRMSLNIENNKEIEFECTNIRTLKFSVYYFSRLFRILKGNPDFDKYSYELLYACIVYSIFYREYHIQFSHLITKYFSINNKSKLITSIRYEKPEKDEEERISKSFLKFYNNITLNPDYAEIYYLVQFGQLDESSILLNIEKWKLQETTVLEKFFQLNEKTNDNEFTEVINEIINNLKSNNLQPTYTNSLLEVYLKLMLYRDRGGIDLKHEELVKIIYDHLEYIKTNIDKTGIASVLKHYLRQSYISDENDDLNKIFEMVVDLNDQIENHQEIEKFNSFYTSLESTGDFFYEQLDKHYSFKPILINFDVKKVITIIEKWTPEQVTNFSQFLARRYVATNIFEFLNDETSFIDDLFSELKTKVEKLPKSNKRIQIKYLIDLLSNIKSKI